MKSEKLRYLAAGAIAGVVSRTVTAPFDRLKILAQVGRLPPPLQQRACVFSQLAQLVRAEGVAGAFRGNGVNCLKVIPSSGTKFLAQELLRRWVVTVGSSNSGQQQQRRRRLSAAEKLFVGGAAGAISTLATHPLEVLHTRVTLGVARATRTSPPSSSPASLYAGVGPALLSVVPFQAVNFFVYERLAEAAHRLPRPLRGAAVRGAVAGAVAMCALYPLDVVKRRMMVLDDSQGMAAVARGIVRQHGVRGLYRGMGTAVFKVVPTVSTNWLVYDLCKRLFRLA